MGTVLECGHEVVGVSGGSVGRLCAEKGIIVILQSVAFATTHEINANPCLYGGPSRDVGIRGETDSNLWQGTSRVRAFQLDLTNVNSPCSAGTGLESLSEVAGMGLPLVVEDIDSGHQEHVAYAWHLLEASEMDVWCESECKNEACPYVACTSKWPVPGRRSFQNIGRNKARVAIIEPRRANFTLIRRSRSVQK